jgi:hypothetical protein
MVIIIVLKAIDYVEGVEINIINVVISYLSLVLQIIFVDQTYLDFETIIQLFEFGHEKYRLQRISTK